MTHAERHPGVDERLLGAAGELTPRAQIEFDRHLDVCAACREAVAEDQRLTTLTRREELSDEFAESGAARARLVTAINDRLAREHAADRPSTLLAPLNPAGVAALVAVVLLAVIAAWPPRQVPDVEPAFGTALAGNWLPDARHTPGAVVPVSLDALCAGTHPAPPPITPELRAEVLHRYGAIEMAEHEYELDYLITPELGGATAAANLWPERYTGSPWNALVKDHLERLLPRKVCNGEVPLAVAQQDIARDWIAAYKKYFDTDTPLAQYAWLSPASRLPLRQ